MISSRQSVVQSWDRGLAKDKGSFEALGGPFIVDARRGFLN